jgi:hypothetical protein
VAVHEARDELPQIAHVARVLAALEVLAHRVVEGGGLGAGAELRHEVVRERHHVLAPLAQRRERARHRGHAVVQVAPEAPRLHLGAQVAVGRAHQAEVGAPPRVAAHALVRALLHGAQELRLLRRRELAELVEEERAAVGERERAVARADGAGEGTPLVAEQLAPRELGDERRAVHEHEVALARPPVERVHEAREQLLPGPRLAGEEHGHVGEERGLDDLTEHAPPRGRRADERVAHERRGDDAVDLRPPPQPRGDRRRVGRAVPRHDVGGAVGEQPPGERRERRGGHARRGQHATAPRRAQRADARAHRVRARREDDHARGVVGGRVLRVVERVGHDLGSRQRGDERALVARRAAVGDEGTTRQRAAGRGAHRSSRARAAGARRTSGETAPVGLLRPEAGQVCPAFARDERTTRVAGRATPPLARGGARERFDARGMARSSAPPRQ